MKKCCDTCIHKKVCDYWEKEAYPNDYGTYDGEPCIDYFSADVTPVVHGEWIPIISYFHGKPTGKYYCSVCHRVENVKGIYCRLCGALMDGGSKNG